MGAPSRQPLTKRLRSSRALGTLVGVVALISGALVIATGVAPPNSLVRLLDGSALLSDQVHGTYVHVNGATGRADLKGSLGRVAAGKKMSVVQRDGHAYIQVDVGGGHSVLYRINDAELTLGASTTVPSRETVVRGGNSAYLVDARLGRIQQIDPETLRAEHKPLLFDGEIRALADDDGSLTVVELSTARAYPVTQSAVHAPISVGSPGAHLDTSTVGGHPVVLNRNRGIAFAFEHGAVHTRIHMSPRLGDYLVPDSIETPDFVVLDRNDQGAGELDTASLDSGKVTRVTIRADVSGVEAPLITPDAVFLPNPDAGELLIVNPNSGTTRKVDPGVGKGDSFDAFVQSGYLFVNDPTGEHAVVVDADGRLREISKYTTTIRDVSLKARKPRTPSVSIRPASSLSNTCRTGCAPTRAGPTRSGTTSPASGASGCRQSCGPPPKIVNKPSAPRNLNATIGTGTVDLTWTAETGGGTILDYQLVCKPDCGNGKRTLSFHNLGAEQYTVRSLTNGTRYTFQISATNEIGSGPLSTPVTATPTGDVPGAPTGVSATAQPDGTVKVDWTPAQDQGHGVTGFVVSGESANRTTFGPWPTPGSAVNELVTPAGAFSLDYDINAVGTKFTVNAIGPPKGGQSVISNPSQESNSVDPYAAPGAPTANQGPRTPGGGTIVVSGAPPDGRPIDEYRIGAPWNRTYPSPGQFSSPLPLNAGTSYTFSVQAHNLAGWGDTTTVTIVPPVAPTIGTIAVSSVGENSAHVSANVDWAGESPGACSLTVVGVASGPCSGLDVSGLLSGGQPYTVTAQASNGLNQAAANNGAASTTFTTANKRLVADASQAFGTCPNGHTYCGGNSHSQPNPSFASGGTLVTQGTVVNADCWRTGGTDTSYYSGASNVWVHIPGLGGNPWMNTLWFNPNSGVTNGLRGC